tara:strand:+ start:290 stop:790 length:501 start_codon:yes stop_codon:yes gene_type:complete
MSTLSVDTIQGQTTAANVKLPTGSILQVVTQPFGAQGMTTASNSYVTTGHALTITPKFSTSNIHLSLQGGGHYLPSYSAFAYVTIYKGGSNLGGSQGFESIYTTAAQSNANDTNYVVTPHSLAHIDNAGSTSALTYTLYIKTAGGTYQYQNSDRASILFTAMEISA